MRRYCKYYHSTTSLRKITPCREEYIGVVMDKNALHLIFLIVKLKMLTMSAELSV